MDSFMYRSLDLAAEYPIRLLVLISSSEFTDDIKCRILHTALRVGGGRSFSYEALSYSWGEEKEKQTIQITYDDEQEPNSLSKQNNGRDEAWNKPQEFFVTKNLHA